MMNETNTKFMCIERVWLALALFAALVGRVMIALDIIDISHTFWVDVTICILSIIVIFLFFQNKFDENSVQPVIAIFGIVMLVAFIGVMVFDSISSVSQELFGVEKITEFNPHPKNAVLKFIGLGISGVIAFYGLFALSRRAAAQEEANELTKTGHAQDQTNAENEKLAKEQAQIQDQFRAAVEHLSSKESSARIASFYEFFYLARYVPNYAESIFGILCAHLRYTKNADIEKELTESQTLINILFSSKAKKIFGNLYYDLRRAKLHRVNFHEIHKPEMIVNFIDADLSKAVFNGNNLSGFIFQSAILHNARFWSADLQKVILFDANLSGARLFKTNVSGADLRWANLRGTDLSNAENLKTAELSGAEYDENTRFPDGFNPKDYGMELCSPYKK